MTNETVDCPLARPLLTVLQAMALHHTRETKVLATALNYSPHTIHTYFNRIFETLGVHTRLEALLVALEHGWIELNPAGEAGHVPPSGQG